MLSLYSDPQQRPRSEDLFFEHYQRLLEWALQLTRGNRWEADDLVQELYIELVRSSTDVEQIQRPEDYLFSVLRNLRYARLRRAGRSAIDDLSIVDFDSIEGGLQAVDRNKLLFIWSDLRYICDFVCERKNSSRTASILLLRFFLGYFPSEIMAVTRSSRIAVDKALQAARREARLALERPGLLAAIDSPKKRKQSARHIDHPAALFRELREKIFSSCTGDCFGHGVLQALYADAEHSFSVKELAHLVSCASCLDEANTILGLPLLEERSPDDTLGRDNLQGPGAAGGNGPQVVSRRNKCSSASGDRRWAQAKRRAHAIDEHRPQRLLIAINGDVRASQRITGEMNELQAKLHRDESPSFIEVLSEQGVRMAFLLVTAPDVEIGFHQGKSLELSDERLLDLSISFADETPIVRVDYRDPLVTQDYASDPWPEESSHPFPKPQKPQPFENVLRRCIHWFQRIRKLLSRWKPATMPEMNPFLASALLLGLASMICFLLWIRSGPHVSADALLERAKSQDIANESSAHGVIYQKVRISTPKQIFDRAIYRDPQGKRRLKKQSLQSSEEELESELLMAGVSWDDPLSAANYKDWHDHHDIQLDTVGRTGNHLLTLTSRPSHDALVLQETLTVRDDDFHPVKRTIDLRDTGKIEIAELNYDVLPWAVVNDSWFESIGGLSAIHNSRGRQSSIHIAAPLPEMELDAAELDARLVLNKLGADTGERITLVRQANGLQVKGIVATEERKLEIETQLVPIPHVIPSIFTFNELKDGPGDDSQITNLRAMNSDETISPLQDYLAHRNWRREDAQHFSEQLLDAAVSIDQDSRAIAGLLQDFDSGKTLLPSAAKSLDELLTRRKERLLKAIDTQQELILQLGNHSTDTDTNHPGSELSALADQNLAFCKALLRNDEASDASTDDFLNKLSNAARQLEILARRVPAQSLSVNSASITASKTIQPDNQR